MKKPRNYIIFATLALLTSSLVLVVPKPNNMKAEAETLIECGAPHGFSMNKIGDDIDGFYFYTDGNNEAPGDWANYGATTEESVSLTRGGSTYACAFATTNGRQNIIQKVEGNKYYMRAVSWVFNPDYLPLQGGDTITIDGTFTGQGYALKFDPASFTLNENADGVVPAHVVEDTIAATSNVRGNNMATSDSGIYFDSKESELYYHPDWSIRYSPKTADNILLTRDNVVNAVGNPALGYIVRYGASQNYIALWPLNSYRPYQDGDLITLEGEFTYTEPDATLNIMTIIDTTFKITESGSDFLVTLISDLSAYVMDTINASYDISEYKVADQELINNKVAETMGQLEELTTSKDKLNLMIETIEYIAAIEPDPEIIQQRIAAIRAAAIEEITNYVNRDDYLEAQAENITALIAEYTEKINASTDRNEIADLVEEFQEKVDLLKTREAIYTEEILANNPMNAEALDTTHLETFDHISLQDLCLTEEINFYQDSNEAFRNINTDTVYDTYNNTFETSPDNTTGSLMFSVLFETNEAEVDMSIAVKMRGIQYYGYKFLLGSVNKGYYIKNTFPNVAQEMVSEHGNHVFQEARSYHLTFGAIDVLDTNKVFLFIFIDHYLFERVIVPKGEAVSNRVDIKMEEQPKPSSTKQVKLTNVDTNRNYDGTTFARKFTPISGKNNADYIYLKGNINNLPYQSDKKLHSYPLSKNAVQLVRNGVSTDIASFDIPIIAKYTADQYMVNLKANGVTAIDQDIIIIDGYFVSYDEEDNEKIIFRFEHTRLQYSATSDAWTKIIYLDEAKTSAYLDIDELGRPEEYDEDEWVALTALKTTYQEKIEAAETIEEVNQELDNFLEAFAKIKTKLQKSKDSLISEWETTITTLLKEYREDEQAEIKALFNAFKIDVQNATTDEEIALLVEEFEEQLQSIPTHKFLLQEELTYAKEETSQTIKDLYGTIDIDSLSDEEIAAINQRILEALADIENAETVEEVENIKKGVLEYLEPYLPKSSRNNGLFFALIGGGAALLLGAAATLFILKKKKILFGGKNK